MIQMFHKQCVVCNSGDVAMEMTKTKFEYNHNGKPVLLPIKFRLYVCDNADCRCEYAGQDKKDAEAKAIKQYLTLMGE